MNKTLSILITTYKNHIVYLADIIGINIIFVLRIIVIITLYKYLYSNFWVNDMINWFTLAQITFAVIVAQAVSTAKPKIVDEINLDVKSGKIWVYLLNPINYLHYKFIEFFPVFLHNLVIWITIWFTLWYILLWVFPITIAWFIAWIFLLFLSMITVFFWYMSIWLLAFYTEDVEAFRYIYSKLDMILWWNLIPIPFLPQILQTIAFLSPFAYFWYTSWLVFSNFEIITFIKYFLIQLFWIIINIWLCVFIYKKAKYKLTINWG